MDPIAEAGDPGTNRQSPVEIGRTRPSNKNSNPRKTKPTKKPKSTKTPTINHPALKGKLSMAIQNNRMKATHTKANPAAAPTSKPATPVAIEA
jgi:hypothetical protein